MYRAVSFSNSLLTHNLEKISNTTVRAGKPVSAVMLCRERATVSPAAGSLYGLLRLRFTQSAAFPKSSLYVCTAGAVGAINFAQCVLLTTSHLLTKVAVDSLALRPVDISRRSAHRDDCA